MKIAHHILLGLCLYAAASFAADYTWTGAGTDSGDWTESANWGVESGYPVAGDTATFSADATITSDFDIGGAEGTTDVLTITIDSGATLTINASISGEAGLTREGAGTLVLKKANPFHGKFQANGWTAVDSSKANIITRIFDGGALGTQSASFDNGKNYSFSSLVVDASESADGVVRITIPLTLGRLVSVDNRPNIQIVNGGADFANTIAAPSRFVIGGGSATEVWFRKAFSDSVWYRFGSGLSSSAHYYFCSKITTGTWYIPYCPSYMHFMAPSNSIYFYQLNNTKIVCGTNDVLTSVLNSSLKLRDTFPWSNNSDTAGGRIDLNGFDQHFPNVTKGLVLVKP